MEWEEVQARLRGGEDEHTEFKRWAGFPRKVGDALCAFANSEGGLVVVGARDDGTLEGLAKDPDDVQERLSSFLQTGLSAPVRARLGRHETPGGWVHWVEVRAMRGFGPLRHRGRVLVRRGRTSTEAEGSELQDLYNTFGFVLTEEQAVPGTSISQVDLHVFREFLARQGLDTDDDPQPEVVQDLKNRGVLLEEDGDQRLTLYGTLCFGGNPQGTPPGRGWGHRSEPGLHFRRSWGAGRGRHG